MSLVPDSSNEQAAKAAAPPPLPTASAPTADRPPVVPDPNARDPAGALDATAEMNRGVGGGLSDAKRERYVRYWLDRYARPVKWLAFGATLGVGVLTWQRLRAENEAKHKMLYLHKGARSYQVIGYAWDQSLKDFNVVYRPLFHAQARLGSTDESHLMGTAPMSYFDEVGTYANLDPASRSLVLPGPFTEDPQWTLSPHLSTVRNSTPAVVASPATSPITVTGHGTSSHAVYKKDI
eukprot:Rhum_TRINITY_DN17413_c0_g1::Rhum_TRINITY_DN17413_c0_g1_i1::g.165953::m.165953